MVASIGNTGGIGDNYPKKNRNLQAQALQAQVEALRQLQELLAKNPDQIARELLKSALKEERGKRATALFNVIFLLNQAGYPISKTILNSEIEVNGRKAGPLKHLLTPWDIETVKTGKEKEFWELRLDDLNAANLLCSIDPRPFAGANPFEPANYIDLKDPLFQKERETIYKGQLYPIERFLILAADAYHVEEKIDVQKNMSPEAFNNLDSFIKAQPE